MQESESVQNDVPQAPPTELKSTSAEDTLLDMWESSPAPTAAPCQAPNIMDLMGDADSTPSLPQPLLSFDDVNDAPLCPSAQDEPSSLVDVAESHDVALSYQPASDSQELEESQELLTNGDSLLKEGTQVRRTSQYPEQAAKMMMMMMMIPHLPHHGLSFVSLRPSCC